MTNKNDAMNILPDRKPMLAIGNGHEVSGPKPCLVGIFLYNEPADAGWCV